MKKKNGAEMKIGSKKNWRGDEHRADTLSPRSGER
jgi:hypothetical protein